MALSVSLLSCSPLGFRDVGLWLLASVSGSHLSLVQHEELVADLLGAPTFFSWLHLTGSVASIALWYW